MTTSGGNELSTPSATRSTVDAERSDSSSKLSTCSSEATTIADARPEASTTRAPVRSTSLRVVSADSARRDAMSTADGSRPAALSPTMLAESTDEGTSERPRTWGQCKEQELGTRANPCPWVSCRYHLLLELTETGRGYSIRLNVKREGKGGRPVERVGNASEVETFIDRALAALERIPDTCALRVAEGGWGEKRAARACGMGKQAVAQFVKQTIVKKVRPEAKRQGLTIDDLFGKGSKT